MSLRLDGHDLNVLAWDGLNLAAPDAVDVLMLSAGNRAEVLVQAGEPGTYQLVLTPSSSARADETGQPDVPAEFRRRSIATVEVTGAGPAMRLPSSLPAFDPPILPIARTRYLEYTVQRQPDDTFVSFGVNGVPFDPDRAPYQMRLGTAEEWTLVNAHDHKLPRHAHGFHIHTNPFKITAINGMQLEKPMWRDTFELAGDDGDSVTFVSNFVDYTGKFVEHCHVLSHEDLGMMESLEVIP
jgi:FtsP/CotA-like multicopper oxidase with cupredoxin domain